MQTLRAVGRLLFAVVHALHGIVIVLLRFPSLGLIARRQKIAWWSARMLKILGLRLNLQGRWHEGAKLIVANHVSWLDIMAIHAVCPHARFVAKAEVRHWPVIRHLVDCAGTIYIERERKRDALRVVHQVAQALAAGDTVAIFPEGTTGPGPQLLPFHANLLQAAIAGGAAVQPVLLRFADAQTAFSPSAAYVGDTTLFGSLRMLARGQGLVVHVTVMPARACVQTDRRLLAQALRAQMAAVLAASVASSVAGSVAGSGG